ncbi:transglutaminaseTgpA domain-containing protein [Glutamicibacter sp. NPDC087344]|uniref:transglutaminase family protein n=1 Tax=Glutamicibacter sp. NPDC087344 TaxID=3363994 RepID=UPI00382CE869
MSTTLDATPAAPAPHAEPEPPAPTQKIIHNLLARTLAALCLAVAVLAGFSSLTGVVEGRVWFAALIFPLLAIHLSAGVLRGIYGLRWLAYPVALLVALVSIVQHEAMLSTGYTLTGFQWFNAVLAEAALQFSTQVPPVAHSRYVAFAILVCALTISLIVELLASFRRVALLVIAPLCFAPVIASLFKQEGAGIWNLVVLIAAVLGYVALLPYVFRDARPLAHPRFPVPRQLGFLGATALVCIAAMLAASYWMPGFRKGMFPEGIRPSGDLLASNVDPLLTLGRDLRANNGSTILDYYTSSDQAPYLRTAVIEDLSQSRWEPNESLPKDTYFGTTAVQDDFTTFNANEQVARLEWANGISSPVLPLPDRSYLIEGIVGNWTWVPESSVARLSGDAVTQTESVSVAYSELDLSPQMARNLGFFGGLSQDEPGEVYRQLPQDPENGLRTALDSALREAYGDADSSGSDFERAVAIQDFLRSRKFVYSERTPLREGYDGANQRVVEAFLERRQGYCVHFASTMALMAREAGIPSRIAVGYAPGKANGQTIQITEDSARGELEAQLAPGTTLTGYSVTGQQSHAWPELYLQGLGWVPFEPTPGQGQPPSYAPQETSTAAPVEFGDEEVPTDRATASPSASAQASEPSAAVQTPPGEPANNWWALLVLAIALAGALSAAPLRRKHIERQRRSVITAGGEPAAEALWVELQAIGADAGRRAGDQESVSDYTRRLADDFPKLDAPLQRLETAIESSFYASRHLQADSAQQLINDLNTVRMQLVQSLPVRVRLAGSIFPASLRVAKLRQLVAVQGSRG